ncbi:hypothetical protein BJX64DRAFT_280718 [Aspergillus heterothallicus]
MAIGAVDRFEMASAAQLFYYAKGLLLDTQQRRARSGTGQVSALHQQSIDEVRCLLCLAHFATWQSNPSIKNEACVLQSLLVQALPLSGLEEEPVQDQQETDWEQWTQHESERRTKLLSFCFLGVQSLAYDTPPSIWCAEIDLKLPCSCPEWTAPNAETWNVVNQSMEPPTPVGNYVLIHGLLQRIIWTPRFMPNSSLLGTASNDYQSVIEPQRAFTYTSTALLSLAYVRNCFDISRAGKISTWSPIQIAQALRTSPSVDRKWSTLLAAYHATNLLSTLVNLGVPYVKQNQSLLLSIEAAPCGLDFSVFLEKWLCQVQDTMHETPLTGP